MNDGELLDLIEDLAKQKERFLASVRIEIVEWLITRRTPPAPLPKLEIVSAITTAEPAPTRSRGRGGSAPGRFLCHRCGKICRTKAAAAIHAKMHRHAAPPADRRSVSPRSDDTPGTTDGVASSDPAPPKQYPTARRTRSASSSSTKLVVDGRPVEVV